MRTYRPKWLRTLRKWRKPSKVIKRALRKKLVRKRVRRPVPIRKPGGFVPGRTLVEWLNHPELGRGLVLAVLPGRMLDVEFEAGGRPPSGVPIEDVRVLV